jgi:hypothetical protein
MVSGLPLAGVMTTPDSVWDCMDSIWLGGVLEDHELVTWYMASHHVLVGPCARLGLDAVDVHVDQYMVTVLRNHLVAARIPRNS